MKEIEKIVNRLRIEVDHAEENHEDMDRVSWNYQEGILISYNDAKAILALIAELDKPQT